jgi:hypothetical protein
VPLPTDEAGYTSTELGCPYEAALALAESENESAQRQALEELQRLEGRVPPPRSSRAASVDAEHVASRADRARQRSKTRTA